MYGIELFNRSNQFMADISQICQNRRWSRQRNEAELLTFSIDLDMLESFGADAGSNPRSILNPYFTQIRLKRNDEYLFGTEVASINLNLDTDRGVVNVSCWGFLNMFKDRYVTVSYEQTPMGDIAWGLIDYTQSQENGTQGITRGSEQYAGRVRDRTYERTNVKDALQNLTNLSDQTIDFDFTYDKKFNVYEMIGSERTDLSFTYPQNIISISVPREATSLYNKIYGLGSGFGDEQVSTTQSDTDSQALFGVREKIFIQNSVVLDDTLEENTRNFLDQSKGILEIPQLALKGQDIDLNSVIPGDRVPVQIRNHSFIDNIDGLYRIEKIEVAIDENDGEDVNVYFDNYGLDV